ncbi:unnamed protein product [Trichobilharzia szidati]|nr:unnamed protein product [Trichobilharzia szidati]
MLKTGLSQLNYAVSSRLVKSRKLSKFTRLPLTWSSSEVIYRENQVPKTTEILIVGGGIIGWATAFWIRQSSKHSVTVVEKDSTLANSATLLGLGSIRQQFSEPENIQMSLFSSHFLRNFKEHLAVEDHSYNIDIDFNPQGCLMLADAKNADSMKENHLLQLDLGARVELLSKQDISTRWPWINTEDIEIGCYGYENEGWFDPSKLLKALKIKCHFMGVNYVIGEVIDFDASPHTVKYRFTDRPLRPSIMSRRLSSATISLPDGTRARIGFHSVVNAAGPWAGRVAQLAEIGTEYLPIRLPVEPRYRHIFVVRPKSVINPEEKTYPLPGLDTPFIIDQNRLFIERRDLSGEFIVYSDNPKFDPIIEKQQNDLSCNSSGNNEFFHEHIKPLLCKRIPGFKDAEVTSSWTAVCDYNTWDQNLILSFHPFHINMYLCNGSSGHGTQHAIAIGKAVTELILFSRFKTLDLVRFSFDRFYFNEAVNESNCF